MVLTREEVDELLAEHRQSLEVHLSAEVRRCVDTRLQALKEDTERWHDALLTTLRRYGEEVPEAQRICQQLHDLRNELSFALGLPEDHSEGLGARTLYRNIRYADRLQDPAKRLLVYGEPNSNRPHCSSLQFGDLLPVQAEQRHGNALWLQLDKGASFSGDNLAGCWVQAELEDGTVQCAKLTGREALGRPRPEEYQGQSFGQMYTEGYDGKQSVMILSASGQAFWDSLNLTCLLRNIATSTVFERGWVDGTDAFDQWVAYYAVNVFRFGLAGVKKELVVTVKPTANWRRYTGPAGAYVLNPEDVREDIGRAQYAECRWVYGMCRKLGINWTDIRFMTALSFLRQHGKWRRLDCVEEAIAQLRRTHQGFADLDADTMQYEFFGQLFCVEEAFGLRDLQADLCLGPEVRENARHLPNVTLWQDQTDPEITAHLPKAMELLVAMKGLWLEARGHVEPVMKRLGLVREDLADLGVLNSPTRNIMHHAAAEGSVEILRPILETLREANFLREGLVRLDSHRRTPLHAAVLAGRAGAARLLIAALQSTGQLRALLSMKDQTGRTLLHWAALAGLEETIEALLAEASAAGDTCLRGSLQSRDPYGWSPLHCAWRQSGALQRLADASVLAGLHNELLQPGAQAPPTGPGERPGRVRRFMQACHSHLRLHASELQRAARRRDQPQVRVLLAVARAAGRLREELLVGGGYFEWGITSDVSRHLDEAAEGFLASTGQLRGLLLDDCTRRETPLQRLVLRTLGQSAASRGLFSLHGGQRALHVALAAKHPKASRVLIAAARSAGELPALLQARDEDNRTPLHWAALHGLEDVTRELLVQAVRDGSGLELLDLTDRLGETPVQAACRQEDSQCSFLRAVLAAGVFQPLLDTPDEFAAQVERQATQRSMTSVMFLLSVAEAQSRLELFLRVAEDCLHWNIPQDLRERIDEQVEEFLRACVLGQGERLGALLQERYARRERVQETILRLLRVAAEEPGWLTRAAGQGHTPLHFVAASGHAAATRVVLQAAQAQGLLDAVLAARDEGGRTPLHMALHANHDTEGRTLSPGDGGVGVLQLLLEAGGREKVREQLVQAEQPLLDYALRAGRQVERTLVQAMFQAGMEETLLSCDSPRGVSTLHGLLGVVAAQQASTERLRELLKAAEQSNRLMSLLLHGSFSSDCSEEVLSIISATATSVGLECRRDLWGSLILVSNSRDPLGFDT